MSYQNKAGRQEAQKGAAGGAFVIIVDMDGNPVAVGGGSGTDLTPLVSRFGDVSGNPAMNTLLGRLNDITKAVSAPKFTYVNGTVQTTAANGTDFVAFPNLGAEMLDITNDTGADLEYRRNGSANTFPILNGQSRLIQGITNINQISVRRTDTGTTQVKVKGEAFKL
ncbi:hypothetical protein PEp14_0004 [Erwinia phage PEp14]|uniref:Uncharacterized protein n=1 Tax=Erwinia phage PEp14 TaxID=1131315 RepID=H2DE34_9CAUD|nr:hypothetical protein PEp14_0004 [Erwinia phage PEp14]AEY69593.1 hypothetical protein PEp14_0004 [Erwinia phage PEp14]